MSASSERVKRWRKNPKDRMISAMGGCCQICGYKKSSRSLTFHHLDPKGKDFSFGSIRASPRNWDAITNELRKCVLLCQNCHGEIHDNIVDLPERFAKFDEGFKGLREKKDPRCVICGIKTLCANSCHQCAMRKRRKFDHSRMLTMKELGMNNSQIAREVGVSETAVRRAMKNIPG